MPHVYRSKPTTVEAALVKDDNLARVAEWCGGKPITQAGRGVVVPTNNGTATAWVGHYVVKSVSDFYPCDPETFTARWERVDSDPSPADELAPDQQRPLGAKSSPPSSSTAGSDE